VVGVRLAADGIDPDFACLPVVRGPASGAAYVEVIEGKNISLACVVEVSNWRLATRWAWRQSVAVVARARATE